MAMNPAECQQMIDAAKAAGKLICIGFQFRYHPNTEMFRRAFDAGEIGDILYVKCRLCVVAAFLTGACLGRRNCRAAADD